MPAKRARKSTHPAQAAGWTDGALRPRALRAACMALPAVIEKIAWGEATWRAGNIFAQTDTHYQSADHLAVWLPARPGVQESLVEENPTQFFRPPYVAHKGWIGVRIDRKPDWTVVAGLVADAYRCVASPALVARLDRRQETNKRGWRPAWVDDEEAEDHE